MLPTCGTEWDGRHDPALTFCPRPVIALTQATQLLPAMMYPAPPDTVGGAETAVEAFIVVDAESTLMTGSTGVAWTGAGLSVAALATNLGGWFGVAPTNNGESSAILISSLFI